MAFAYSGVTFWIFMAMSLSRSTSYPAALMRSVYAVCAEWSPLSLAVGLLGAGCASLFAGLGEGFGAASWGGAEAVGGSTAFALGAELVWSGVAATACACTGWMPAMSCGAEMASTMALAATAASETGRALFGETSGSPRMRAIRLRNLVRDWYPSSAMARCMRVARCCSRRKSALA